MPSNRADDPYEVMSSPSTEIDEQLASEMEEGTIRHLYQNWAARLTTRCEATNRAISEAWEKIQHEMTVFEKQKKVYYSTLKKLEGHDRATRVIRMGLDDIVPTTYKEITKQVENRQPSNYISPLLSPQHDEGLFVTPSRPSAGLHNQPTSSKPPGPAQSGQSVQNTQSVQNALGLGSATSLAATAEPALPKSPSKSTGAKVPITVSSTIFRSQVTANHYR